jgi:predicted Zn-dependent protease
MTNEKKIDPLMEAKTYIEFGQIEQAEKVLEKAIQEYPSRREFQDALSEVRGLARHTKFMNSNERLSLFFSLVLAATLIFFGQYLALLRDIGTTLAAASVIFVLFCVFRGRRDFLLKRTKK